MTAYLVFGPESSGTRFFTKMLINAGCEGSGDHQQAFDQRIEGENIVWRRSFPHYVHKEFVDIEAMLKRLKGYEITVIVPMRDWHSMILSQVANRHAIDTPEKARENIQKAYKHIFKAIIDNNLNYITVNYEQITQRGQKAIDTFLAMLGMQGKIKVTDGNSKYYES
ncbi:MAG: hypothetical protein ABEK17_04270 [Candidatus Aenigmatarchaeota archaeon]